MVRLRKIEPEDLPFLYKWENDGAAWADGSVRNPLSQFDLRQYIEQSAGDIYKDGQLRLIAECEAEDGKFTIGAVDLYDFDPRNLRAGVGIYIAPEYRQKGYGLQALRLLDDYAFSFLRLRLLYAFVSVANTASQNLFRSAGYTPSSAIPDWTLDGDAAIWSKIGID